MMSNEVADSVSLTIPWESGSYTRSRLGIHRSLSICCYFRFPISGRPTSRFYVPFQTAALAHSVRSLLTRYDTILFLQIVST